MEGNSEHPERFELEYAPPQIVELGDLVELTAAPGKGGGGFNKPSVFCDGNSGTSGNFGVGNADRGPCS